MSEESTRSHQVRKGRHECLAIGKNDVTLWTSREGQAACGHCQAYLTDEHGEKIPFTIKDDWVKRGTITRKEA